MIYEVHQTSNNCQSITIKYFEKGHTFLAADAFHKSVGDEMRHQKYLYDFSDFVKVIDTEGKAHEMRYFDFRDYTKEVSKAADTY